MSTPTPASAFESVPDLWLHRVDSTPDMESFTFRRGGGWVSWTWRDTDDHVRQVAGAILAAGLEPGSRCAILSATRVEWIVADLAVLCCGCATTTVFPTSSEGDLRHILADSGACWVFCDTPRQVERLRQLRDDLPELERVVAFDAPSSEDGWVVSLAELMEIGGAWLSSQPQAFETAARKPTGDSLATLIYTSGTTGLPKGVMLSHDAWIYEAEAVDSLGVLTPADRQLLFLPLAHVFAKVLEVISIRLGLSTVIEGRAERLLEVLQETHPTWLAGVPYIFDRVRRLVSEAAAERGGLSERTLRWALSVSAEVRAVHERGDPVGPLLAGRHAVADRLVFRRIRLYLGGRLRFLISGAAPLSTETADFFTLVGLPLCEGYGLTESAAASCTNLPDDNRIGTVGRPLPGCEVSVEVDGELLLRSRGIMQGYWGLPEETAEALTEDGWLRTGDIGQVLDTGHVRITDRKKAILVSAGGKNIAPARFERALVARSPFVQHAVLAGERRPFCVVLVTIDPTAVGPWLREQGIGVTDYASMVARPEVHTAIEAAVEQVNQDLPPWERAGAVWLLPTPLTQDNGLLTPSLKVRRQALLERFADDIDHVYEVARATKRQARR